MALPPVVRFDFSGFVEGKHCMHYKSLFASETPLLKGANLCPFLTSLDEEEYAAIKQENVELMAEQKAQRDAAQKEVDNLQWYWRGGKYVLVALGILALTGAIYSAWNASKESKRLDEVEEGIRRQLPPRPSADADYETRQKYEQDVSKVHSHAWEQGGDTRRNTLESLESRARILGGSSVALGAGSGVCALVEANVNPTSSKDVKDLEICKNRELRILDKIHRIETRIKAIHDESEIEQLQRARNYFNQFRSVSRENVVLHQHVHFKV